MCMILLAICGQAAEQQEKSADRSPRPVVAVPLFVNATNGVIHRIRPGTYREDARLKIEYAPGEWTLPRVAAQVATDATSAALADIGEWMVFPGTSPVIREIDTRSILANEKPTKGAAIVYEKLREANVSYLLLGRINQFRVDEVHGEYYGVRLWQVETSVSMDIQLIDTKSGALVVGRQMSKKVVKNIPEGVTYVSSVYNWEEALREAVNQVIPEILPSTQGNTTPRRRQSPTVTIRISSMPEGADVEFNGGFVGNTPCQVSLPAEKGVLTISLGGYEKWSKQIVPNETLKINPTLRKKIPASTGSSEGS